MSKNLQIIIGIAILLIAVSVFYYLVIFLPRIEKERATKEAEAGTTAVQRAVIKFCEDKYDTLSKTSNRDGKGCLPTDSSNIESIYYCSDFKNVRMTKDVYVDSCEGLLNLK
ncbi:MAG: hypothetical protein ABH830_02320 [Patescibacteria group bacterium]